MRCPVCQNASTNVKDSRETDEGKVIRRRRLCIKCQTRFTTFERIQLRTLTVIKRSGAKRAFDRTKIFKSINTALRKKNYAVEEIENITDKISLTLESANSREIKSTTIGKLILQELAKIDQVAYIRFASVYQDFTNAKDFARFISKIDKKSR
ncbi:MAG: transcriptional regulator NrdR [Rickettsiaceae bacterium]